MPSGLRSRPPRGPEPRLGGLSGDLEGAEPADREERGADQDDRAHDHGRGQLKIGLEDGRGDVSDGLREGERLLPDAEGARPGEEPGEEALPDQDVGEAKDQRPAGDQAERHEDGAVQERADGGPGHHPDDEPVAEPTDPDQAGQQHRAARQGSGAGSGDDQLGDHHRAAADRLREQEDGGAVLDLPAERPGPEEQGHEWHEGADPQAGEQPGGERQRARLLAGDAEDARHQHQHPGQQEQQQRPSPREELAQGDPRDDAVHRRTR